MDPLDDDREEPGRPVAAPAELPLVDAPGQSTDTIVGYQLEYPPERKLWFVEITLDPGTAFWPFLRLAVVRYQTESLSGVRLSPVVVCDFTSFPRIGPPPSPDPTCIMHG